MVHFGEFWQQGIKLNAINPVSACRYDAERHALVVDLEGRNFLLDPAHVRRNDTSAASINEWTGEKLNRSDNISDDIQPDTIAPLGNYAVQILWQDGFNQVHRPWFGFLLSLRAFP